MNLCFTETIKDYPGFLITRDGRVISLTRRVKNGKIFKGQILKPYPDQRYSTVGISNGTKRKFLLIHRLVAIAFIPNPNNFPHVNHKNGIKTDNRVENLEWCTPSQNMIHARDVLKWRAGSPKKSVKQIKNGQVIKIWESGTAPEKHGFNQAHISSCCLGKRITHKGFNWEYV